MSRRTSRWPSRPVPTIPCKQIHIDPKLPFVDQRVQVGAPRDHEFDVDSSPMSSDPVASDDDVGPAPALVDDIAQALVIPAVAEHTVLTFKYVAPVHAAPAPVIEYVAPTPSVTLEDPAPVIEYVAPAPAATFAAPAKMIEYVALAPCRFPKQRFLQ